MIFLDLGQNADHSKNLMKFCLFQGIPSQKFHKHLSKTFWVIFIARQHTAADARYIDIVILSVCLSVRDMLVLYENGLTYRHSFSTIR